jgi:hypothetical protein
MKFSPPRYTYEDTPEAERAYREACLTVQNMHRENWERIQPTLPNHIVELGELQGVEDGLLWRVEREKQREALRLFLRCGDLMRGYFDLFLDYSHAEINAEHERNLIQIARNTHSGGRHTSDLRWHEIDLTEAGRIEHRLEFYVLNTEPLWFAIQCSDIQWQKVSRPNRNFPYRKERYLEMRGRTRVR